MIPSNLIAKKRDGKALSKKEIYWLVNSFLNKEISDSQMSSFLMTIFFRGMNVREISSLVNVMIESGSKLDFSDSNYFIADKHSTGGIGDKTSLILAPILGSLGIKIPMIAGRALAFTGGTIDKLESISGFQSKQSLKKRTIPLLFQFQHHSKNKKERKKNCGTDRSCTIISIRTVSYIHNNIYIPSHSVGTGCNTTIPQFVTCTYMYVCTHICRIQEFNRYCFLCLSYCLPIEIGFLPAAF